MLSMPVMVVGEKHHETPICGDEEGSAHGAEPASLEAAHERQKGHWRLICQWADSGMWDSEVAPVADLTCAGHVLFANGNLRVCELWHSTRGLVLAGDDWLLPVAKIAEKVTS